MLRLCQLLVEKNAQEILQIFAKKHSNTFSLLIR